MLGWSKRTLILMLALLIFVPLVTEWWRVRTELRRARYNYELTARYECFPDLTTYPADFDGDGHSEFLLAERLPRLSERWLTVVNDEGRALVRLPFGIARDGRRRTHAAVVNQMGRPHLLVYDRVNYHQPLKVVYAFDGRDMSQVAPTAFEQEILAALEARDGINEWEAGEALVLRSLLKLAGYYFVLAVIVFVAIYRRLNSPQPYSFYHSMRGNP